MKLKSALLTFAIGGLFVVTLQAAVVTHTGDTTADPTYNRAIVDLSGLSSVGTAVPYDIYTFTVATSGNYTFLTTGTFDTFATLYSPMVAPPPPQLVNAKIANDDLVSVSTSGFEYALVAGVSYSYVTTGFSNLDFGVFSTTIGGVGAITPAVAEGPAVTSPQIYTRTGITTNGPTFDRPIEDLTGLSVVGAGVPYNSFTFQATATGDYTFVTTGNFDTFDFLYSPTLTVNPLVNLKAANDDLLSFNTSGLVYALSVGVDYTFVTTGFTPAENGSFSTTIGGPGSIVPVVAAVPEPGAMALIFAGLAAMSLLARRRKLQGAAPHLTKQWNRRRRATGSFT